MSDYTPGPWVQFADQGKCIAVMPAMREGDVCTFNQPPSDADARLIAAAPALYEACASVWLMLAATGDNELRLIADECRAALELAGPALTNGERDSG